MQNTMNEAGNEGGSVTFVLPDAHLLDYQLLAAWDFDHSGNSALPEEPPSPVTGPLPGTFGIVIADFMSEPESTFQGLRYHVRENHRTMLRRVDDRYGFWKLTAIDTRDIKAWYRDWSSDGKIASGHAFIGQLRTLLTHGVLLLPDGPEREQCRRIKELLSGMKFPQPAPREERLTAEQAIAIRAAAHEHFGWHSIALAQALQFELMLRQKDCIGEWVPIEEPGESDVTHRGEKWLRGLRWSEVDENMILRHVTSKRQKPVVVDLRQCPMVAEELELSVSRSVSGPIVICDTTGLPWKASEFRRKWRLVARHAGVPDNIRSMDSRAGAITEALDSGVDKDLVRQAATHSNIAMTMRYDRGDQLKRRSTLQEARLASRKKAGE